MEVVAVPAYLWPPAVVPGEHVVNTADILAEVRRRHPDVPWLERAEGIAASTGIRTRRWMQPLEFVAAPGHWRPPEAAVHQALAAAGVELPAAARTIAALEAIPAPRTIEERNAPAWAAVQDYGERAARQALETAGLAPGDVDSLITSHSTTPALPGLDISLANRLDLRDDVLLLPASQWACIAGTRSLALAAQLVATDPDKKVLVVISEALSTTYQPADATLESLLTRLLFADTAVAAVVSGRPAPGVCLRLDAVWHHTLRDTAHLHQLHTKADGVHFVMGRSGPSAVQTTFPSMWAWLRGRHPRPDWHPDLLLAHPGGTRVLQYIEKTLPPEWPSDLLTHSWDSYTTGNRGGASVFDIVDRAHRAGPKSGARTVLYAAAPGLTATAVDGEWI
jgi:germicidin synthase